jgi:murein DD-endopeptidase MepM/ murein hydrolase activator NlpD
MNYNKYVFILVLGFLLFTLSNIVNAQTKVEIEKFKKEEQSNIDKFKDQESKNVQDYKNKQDEEIEKLRQEFIKYEKLRENLISSFENQNIDPEKKKKAIEAEKQNQLNEEPQPIVIDDEKIVTETPKEPEKEIVVKPKPDENNNADDEKIVIETPKEPEKEKEIVVKPKPKTEENHKVEVESNRPVFFPLNKKFPVTSHYSKKRVHPVIRVRRPHNGIDFGAPKGSPVFSTADGIIEIARYSNSAGNWVMVNHYNGYKTVYMHFSKLNVKEGQKVKRGQVIGNVGNTGYSTGPHLHYEVRYNNVPLNPIKFLVYENG